MGLRGNLVSLFKINNKMLGSLQHSNFENNSQSQKSDSMEKLQFKNINHQKYKNRKERRMEKKFDETEEIRPMVYIKKETTLFRLKKAPNNVISLKKQTSKTKKIVKKPICTQNKVKLSNKSKLILQKNYSFDRYSEIRKNSNNRSQRQRKRRRRNEEVFEKSIENKSNSEKAEKFKSNKEEQIMKDQLIKSVKTQLFSLNMDQILKMGSKLNINLVLGIKSEANLNDPMLRYKNLLLQNIQKKEKEKEKYISERSIINNEITKIKKDLEKFNVRPTFICISTQNSAYKYDDKNTQQLSQIHKKDVDSNLIKPIPIRRSKAEIDEYIQSILNNDSKNKI